jgi:hypothetical protein
MESCQVADQKEVVRRAIHELMGELTSHPFAPRYCKNCLEKMRYIKATFFLYGTERAWNVVVPTCACATEKPHPGLPEKALPRRVGIM